MTALRFIVLLSLFVLILPGDSKQNKNLWLAARDIATWTMTTCERNQQSCELATDMWARLKDKSARSVAMLGTMVGDQLGDKPMSIDALIASLTGRPTDPVDTGTLSKADRTAPWLGRLPSLP